MPDMQPYYFVSHSYRDRRRTDGIVQQLNARGVQTWRDVEQLHPGDDWEQAIGQALKNAAGMIVFVSSQSMQSPYVLNEIALMDSSGYPIIPVLLEQLSTLPESIGSRQWIDLSGADTTLQFEQLVQMLLHAQRTVRAVPSLDISTVAEVASRAAREVEEETDTSEPAQPQPDSVFLVHGHDLAFLNDVQGTLHGLGVRCVVLVQEENKGQSVFEKFWQFSAQAKFAIVLFSPDDYGTSLREYNSDYMGSKAAERALNFRARQNVVLEMGFFYGRLGTDCVFVLNRNPDSFFPRFERPSDLDGILFDEYRPNDSGWQTTLKKWLVRHDFALKDAIS